MLSIKTQRYKSGLSCAVLSWITMDAVWLKIQLYFPEIGTTYRGVPSRKGSGLGRPNCI